MLNFYGLLLCVFIYHWLIYAQNHSFNKIRVANFLIFPACMFCVGRRGEENAGKHYDSLEIKEPSQITIVKDNLHFYFVNLCLSTSVLTYLCGYDALIPFFCYHKDGLVHWIPRRAYRWYSAFWLFTKAEQRKKSISWLLTTLTLKIYHEYGAVEWDSHVQGKCMGSSFTHSVSVGILC